MGLRFLSTNKDLPGGYTDAVSFRQALSMGLAPDAGLFMPERIPVFTTSQLEGLRQAPYATVAAAVLDLFLGDELGPSVISSICQDAYNFPVPLEPCTPDAPLTGQASRAQPGAGNSTFILRLDQGPTASFKDFAARFMARAMERLCERDLTVLVATSGDTGSAVGAAFAGMKGARVYILYPAHGVSDVQRQQLDRCGDNVTALAIDGTFDDCQALAKQAFALSHDDTLSPLARIGLTSANSINIGRVLPQVAYHVYAWLQTGAPVMLIPSGNFGNALGAEIARRMGLPFQRIIVAVNSNDAFPAYLQSGIYRKVSPSKECISNAMNVGHPSNLARFIHLYGGIMDKEGLIHQMPDLAGMRRDLWSVSISDEETIAAMRRAWQGTMPGLPKGTLLEPHGAVGIAALEQYRELYGPCNAVVLETAHPAKFPEAMEKALGHAPRPPEALERMMRRPARVRRMANDIESLIAELTRP
ncbi:threonine synthase [Candidatus Woesearchaeota archaeon CG1_02_57_44]|nr:MAG: threonine synthase [Candidatus Woesearchaeota archaeon CG1_02_57_44]